MGPLMARQAVHLDGAGGAEAARGWARSRQSIPVFRAFVSEGATEFGDEGEGGKRHSGGEERRVTKHW